MFASTMHTPFPTLYSPPPTLQLIWLPIPTLSMSTIFLRCYQQISIQYQVQYSLFRYLNFQYIVLQMVACTSHAQGVLHLYRINPLADWWQLAKQTDHQIMLYCLYQPYRYGCSACGQVNVWVFVYQMVQYSADSCTILIIALYSSSYELSYGHLLS